MKPVIRNVAATAAFFLSLAFGSAMGHAQSNQHTLKLENDSAYDIYEVHMSPASDNDWGPDLLRDRVLSSGKVFSMFRVANGEYDIKLIDEDGDECIRRISIFNNRTWDITTQRLVGCELHELSH